MAISMKKGLNAVVGILSGMVGDYLDEQENELAVQMQFHIHGKPLTLSPDTLKEAYPDRTSKVCILIHGLMCDESTWTFRDDSENTYGSLLQEDLGYTPFYLRYNTGLHISKNGQKFSEMMENFFNAYPVDIEEIVVIAHSMGGLVTRSACHNATQHQMDWVKKVQKLFFLGSPHLGVPLEKVGNVVSNILQAVPRPYTKLAGDVVNLRSAGIKDLRYGYVTDEDWEGQDPDAILQNNKTTIPLIDGVSHYIITGTLTKAPEHLVAQWFGDAMVRKPSALGQSKKEAHNIPFPSEHHREFPKVGHLKLTRFSEIYEQIKLWCQETSSDE